MLYYLLAHLVMLLHFGFILFAVLGALWVARRPRLAWLHLPAVMWAAAIEFYGGVCPLTPLENRLRRMGGAAEYEESFIEHYLAAVIYPAHLTGTLQIALGLGVLIINVALYAWIIKRRRHSAGKTHPAHVDNNRSR
jgi:small-conductance mechanosensitive channel